MLMPGLIAAVLLTAPPAFQTSATEMPRFRYVLPEGFRGWACVDFGVADAPPLRRDAGLFVVEPQNDVIVRTSSLPALSMPPFPAELIRMVDGKGHRTDVTTTLSRGHSDSKDPVARHCLFFGSAEAAARFPRPPTLTESRLGTDPVLQDFEFVRGDLCEFHGVPRVCLATSGEGSRPAVRSVRQTLGDSVTVTTGDCDAFDGIAIEYRTDRSEQTHSSARGALFAHAEVRREIPGRGTTALVIWANTETRSADRLAAEFARELAFFLGQAAAKTCTR